MQNYCERWLAAIHRRKPDREYERELNSDAEARLLKLACNDPPEGYSRWTLHLLADELVILDEIDFESISHETVPQRLKNTPKPHLSSYWKMLSEPDADFVYYMEDVLALYSQPYDETCPVICFGESSKALRGHERDPLPGEPGAVARGDHRYKRSRKQRLDITAESLTGWVAVEVTKRRRTVEWINKMVGWLSVQYPVADRIRVVIDQPNMNKPAAFYDFFPPKQTKTYLDRFEFHYTPKRGSWLPVARAAPLDELS